jgi:Xaa-Pro aminopeptidase
MEAGLTGWFDERRLGLLMQEAGVSAIVATSEWHIGYLTGFLSPFIPQRHQVSAAVWSPGSAPALVVPNHEILRAYDTNVRDIDLQPFGSYHFYNQATTEDLLYDFYNAKMERRKPDFASAIEDALRRRGAKGAIAFDDFGLSADARAVVTAHLNANGWTLANGTRLLQQARIVKTDREIAVLDEATVITERAMSEVLEQTRPGISEKEMFELYRTSVQRQGADVGHWLTTMGSDRSWTVLGPSDRRLKPNEQIRMDGGVKYKGYITDVGCVVAGGDCAREIADVHSRLEQGLAAAAAAAKPGVMLSEVFARGVQAVLDAGMPDYKRGNIGHGIGREAYELPTVRPAGQRDLLFDGDRDDFVVEPNMILNLEMPYMVHGYGGFIVERMYVVEPGGTRQLGTFDHKMRVLIN